MLVLARRWEVETGQTLDGVLQVGDMGAFPDTDRLDRATRKHAAADPDELGYSAYLRGCPEGQVLLGGAGWPVLWVRGNHEDFDHLAQFEVPTAVDPWGRLCFVPDGTTATVAGLRVGAMGGMPRPGVPRGRRQRARAALRETTPPERPDWIVPRQAATAYPDGGLDILLSHAGPAGLTRGGSRFLSDMVERVRPRVHLFGHHHLRLGPVSDPGGTVTIGLDHLGFVSERLQSGCWGILALDEDGVQWTWGEDVPWCHQVRRSGYRSWIAALQAS